MPYFRSAVESVAVKVRVKRMGVEEKRDCFCGKEHIDLRDKITFQSQGSGNTNCKRVCDSIISVLNIVSEGATELLSNGKYGAFYQVALENEENTALIHNKEKSLAGINYLNSSLEKGLPVIVGINHTFRKDKTRNQNINEYTTDHFVVIVGRHCENDTIYYRFWDVGSSRGASGDFKFELIDNYKLTCHSDYNSRKIDVTQIRRNKTL
jgi:hypothetical protein